MDKENIKNMQNSLKNMNASIGNLHAQFNQQRNMIEEMAKTNPEIDLTEIKKADKLVAEAMAMFNKLK